MIAMMALFATCWPKVGPTDLRVEALRRRSRARTAWSSSVLDPVRSRSGVNLRLRSGSRCCRSAGSRPPGSSRRSASGMPAVARAPCGPRRRVAGFASAAWIRLPDSKSMPRLSCLVANAIAPIARITPESEKNYFEAPVKSNFQRRPSPLAPSAGRRVQDLRAAEQPEDRLGEEHGGEQRDDRADAEREREALDPRGRQPEEDERGQQRDHVGVDDRRDALAVALGDRGQHRSPGAHLLLDPLEDDDVRVGGDADRQHQAGDTRQRHRDRQQLDQREVEERVDEQAERRR